MSHRTTPKVGKELKKLYECIEDSSRFEMKMARQNLLTFASEAGQHKLKK